MVWNSNGQIIGMRMYSENISSIGLRSERERGESGEWWENAQTTKTTILVPSRLSGIVIEFGGSTGQMPQSNRLVGSNIHRTVYCCGVCVSASE